MFNFGRKLKFRLNVDSDFTNKDIIQITTSLQNTLTLDFKLKITSLNGDKHLNLHTIYSFTTTYFNFEHLHAHLSYLFRYFLEFLLQYVSYF